MTIRDAVEADLPAIIAIYNAAIATRIATAQLERVNIEHWFSDHSTDGYPFWVAEIEGRVAGWLSFKRFLPRCAYRGTAEISVYVDEKLRRRGVARRLVREAIARAPSLGINALVGLIFGHNEPSLKLFEQLGFQRWGHLPGVAQLEAVERDLIVMGQHCPARRDAIVKETTYADTLQPHSYKDCLNLMRTLMDYRQQPIHSTLLKSATNIPCCIWTC
ncbi:MAG: N-acetyltransferase [Verrucomicrobia bacterium]|nr:MAG: N-acetyltransferase [Verrucomicrobiota bacterium]